MTGTPDQNYITEATEFRERHLWSDTYAIAAYFKERDARIAESERMRCAEVAMLFTVREDASIYPGLPFKQMNQNAQWIAHTTAQQIAAAILDATPQSQAAEPTDAERLREAVEKIAEYCEAEHSINAGGPMTNGIVNTLLHRVGRDLRAALSPPGPLQPSAEERAEEWPHDSGGFIEEDFYGEDFGSHD